MRRILKRTRVRLTLASTAIVLVVASLGGGVYWIAFSHAQLGVVDATLLRAQGRLLASGVVDDGSGYHFREPLAAVEDTTAGGAAIEDMLLGPGNTVLDASVPAPNVAAVTAVVAHAPTDRTAVTDTVSAGGASERALVRRIELPRGAGQATLVLTTPLATDDELLGRTAFFLIIAVAIISLTAAATSYWLAGRVLRPVRQIAGMARAMSERNLNQRITLQLPDDEIGDLASTFNGMLARLEAAFVTLRQFTADAAHELRAPLAVLTTEVEVALKRPRSSDAYQATLTTVRAETERLSLVANQLLTLALADAGALQPSLELIEVPDLVEDLADRWRTVASERDVTIATHLPPGGYVSVDVDMLRSLVDNLMSNAVRHARRGGVITVAATVDATAWTLLVEDDGGGVPTELRPRLFKRFARAASARNRETGGAGLGLSICAVIARLHGGHIALDDDPEHPARFVVTIPVDGGAGRDISLHAGA